MPWQHKIIALARKVNQMGWFFSFNQKTPHSCTFFHCQGRRQSERRRGEKEAERGTVGGIWIGPASKTQRVVFFTREKDSSWASNSILGCVWRASNHTKSLSVVVFEWLGTLFQNYNQRNKMVMFSGPFENIKRCPFSSEEIFLP